MYVQRGNTQCTDRNAIVTTARTGRMSAQVTDHKSQITEHSDTESEVRNPKARGNASGPPESWPKRRSRGI